MDGLSENIASNNTIMKFLGVIFTLTLIGLAAVYGAIFLAGLVAGFVFAVIFGTIIIIVLGIVLIVLYKISPRDLNLK